MQNECNAIVRYIAFERYIIYIMSHKTEPLYSCPYLYLATDGLKARQWPTDKVYIHWENEAVIDELTLSQEDKLQSKVII